MKKLYYHKKKYGRMGLKNRGYGRRSKKNPKMVIFCMDLLHGLVAKMSENSIKINQNM